MTVAHQHLFQGWSCRLPGKYRDLLPDIGTGEMAHVETICTMTVRLLQDAPVSARDAAQDDIGASAVAGGLNPAHLIQAGGGTLPMDSQASKGGWALAADIGDQPPAVHGEAPVLPPGDPLLCGTAPLPPSD